MSVNAFYDAYGATQNALGDPRGDAERRRQQEMQNAMAQQRFDMQRQDFERQAEARRREQETADLQARGAQARYGSMFGGQAQPMQPPSIPMPQGAQAQPMAQPAAQGSQMTNDGYDMVQVNATQRPKFSAVDGLQRQAELYAQNNRWDLVEQIMPELEKAKAAERQAGLDEERQGYDLNTKTYDGIAQWAVLTAPQIAQIPPNPGWENRVNALVQDAARRLNEMGLDGGLLIREAQIQPGDTPQSIAAELDSLISQMGGPDAIKSRFNTNQVNAGDRMITRTEAGTVVGVDRVGVDPATIARNRAQIRTAQIGANSRIEAANIRKSGDEEEEQGQPNEIGPWTEYQQPSAQGQPR
jgi:hypothetical protein